MYFISEHMITQKQSDAKLTNDACAYTHTYRIQSQKKSHSIRDSVAGDLHVFVYIDAWYVRLCESQCDI